MKRQRWLLQGLLVLLFSLTTVAAANGSSLGISSTGIYSRDYFDGLSHRSDITTSGGAFNSFFDLTPTKPGFFSQRVNCTTSFGISGHQAVLVYDPLWVYDPPVFDVKTYESSTSVGGSATVSWDIQLDQSGPLRFNDLTWEGRLLNDDGSSTTLFSKTAGADLIANGGFNYGYQIYEYEEMDVPIMVYEVYSYYGSGHYWIGSDISTRDITPETVILSVTGNVVSTLSAQQILSFFDNAVSTGNLTGEGPGKSADGLLNAFRNMLLEVDSLIAAGNMEEAYQQLADAYKKTDGDYRIPDFVSGEASTELAQMILDLKASLEQTTLLAFSTSATSQNPVPATVWLLGSSLLGLAGWRRFRKK